VIRPSRDEHFTTKAGSSLLSEWKTTHSRGPNWAYRTIGHNERPMSIGPIGPEAVDVKQHPPRVAPVVPTARVEEVN